MLHYILYMMVCMVLLILFLVVLFSCCIQLIPINKQYVNQYNQLVNIKLQFNKLHYNFVRKRFIELTLVNTECVINITDPVDHHPHHTNNAVQLNSTSKQRTNIQSWQLSVFELITWFISINIDTINIIIQSNHLQCTIRHNGVQISAKPTNSSGKHVHSMAYLIAHVLV